jgi:hypothetical protein
VVKVWPTSRPETWWSQGQQVTIPPGYWRIDAGDVALSRLVLGECIAQSTIYDWFCKGKLRAIKLGDRRVLIEPDSVDDLIRRGRVEAVRPRKKGPVPQPRKYAHCSLD